LRSGDFAHFGIDFLQLNAILSGIVVLVLWACEVICAPTYNFKYDPETWDLKDVTSVRNKLLEIIRKKWGHAKNCCGVDKFDEWSSPRSGH
jgi:hypothetical protein